MLISGAAVDGWCAPQAGSRCVHMCGFAGGACWLASSSATSSAHTTPPQRPPVRVQQSDDHRHVGAADAGGDVSSQQARHRGNRHCGGSEGGVGGDGPSSQAWLGRTLLIGSNTATPCFAWPVAAPASTATACSQLQIVSLSSRLAYQWPPRPQSRPGCRAPQTPLLPPRSRPAWSRCTSSCLGWGRRKQNVWSV